VVLLEQNRGSGWLKKLVRTGWQMECRAPAEAEPAEIDRLSLSPGRSVPRRPRLRHRLKEYEPEDLFLSSQDTDVGVEVLSFANHLAGFLCPLQCKGRYLCRLESYIASCLGTEAE
jgi:hypothetical protein